MKWFGIGLPNSGYRANCGIILVILYFLGHAAGVRKLWFKFFLSMGAVRFQIMMFLLLCMFSLPIKMVLRWTINLNMSWRSRSTSSISSAEVDGKMAEIGGRAPWPNVNFVSTRGGRKK